MSDTLNQLIRGPAATFNAGNAVQVNPLAAITAGNQAANTEFEARAWQAKQAAGNAFLQSIDPNTGQPNQAQLLRNLAANPATAMAAQPSAQAGQTLDQETYDLHNKRLTGLMSGMGQLIADNPNGVPTDAANSVIDHRLQLGLITPEQAQTMKGHFGADPVQNTKVILQGMTSNLSAQTALEAVRPGTGTIDRGPAVQGFQTPPRVAATATQGAVTPVGPGVTKSLGPGLVEIGTNPDGTKRMGTNQQAENLAAGRDANDNGPNAAAPGLGTGRPPAALLNPNKPPPPPPPQQPPSAQQPPPAQSGSDTSAPPKAAGFTTGQGTAQRSAQETTGTGSAQKFQDIVTQGVQAKSQDALLANLASAASQIRVGPAAEYANDVKRTILGIGAQFGTTFGIDADKMKNMEDVIKIGNQLANAQGAGSDARLKVNEGSNPSYHNTPAGLDFIVRQLRGNTDYQAARQKLAAAYPDKSDIEGFESKAGANLDPRVFQYQRMAPGKMREDYFNTIAPADKPAFKKSYQWAEQNGVIGG